MSLDNRLAAPRGSGVKARALYRLAAAGKSRLVVPPRVFEANLLVARREKELALDPAPRTGGLL